MVEIDYYQKYLKYKQKYLKQKNLQIGGENITLTIKQFSRPDNNFSVNFDTKKPIFFLKELILKTHLESLKDITTDFILVYNGKRLDDLNKTPEDYGIIKDERLFLVDKKI